MKKYIMVMEIEFANEAEARRTYAHLTGRNEWELSPREQNGTMSFSGACVPSLFTLMRPATVTIRPE